MQIVAQRCVVCCGARHGVNTLMLNALSALTAPSAQLAPPPAAGVWPPLMTVAVGYAGADNPVFYKPMTR